MWKEDTSKCKSLASFVMQFSLHVKALKNMQNTNINMNCCFNFVLLIVGPEERILSCMMKNEQGWNCLSCGWITKNKTRLFVHVEAKHMPGVGYNCPICDKLCPSLNALNAHKSRNHRNVTRSEESVNLPQAFVGSPLIFRESKK